MNKNSKTRSHSLLLLKAGMYKEENVQDLSRTVMAGFCLSSYMLVVIPVVAMLMGLGLLVGVDLSLTPPLATDDDLSLIHI